MTDAIRLDGLVKHYGDVAAVDGIDLQVAEGEVHGLLGPNGAGKTTTIRCLLGFIHPSAGTMRVLGRDPAAELGPILAAVGHLPGEFGLWPHLTGRDTLAYLGRLNPAPPERREELCERFELSDHDLDKPVRLYSRGMKQKIGIVQAFEHRPELLVLDEPTEGLDPLMKDRFVELVREHRDGGGTVLLSSHILSEVEQVAGRVTVLRRGRVVRAGPVEDLSAARVRHCTLTLPGDASPERVVRLEGVSEVQTVGSITRFDYRGPIGPLLAAVSALPAEDFLCEPATLVETFLEVYAEPDGDGRP